MGPPDTVLGTSVQLSLREGVQSRLRQRSLLLGMPGLLLGMVVPLQERPGDVLLGVVGGLAGSYVLMPMLKLKLMLMSLIRMLCVFRRGSVYQRAVC